MSLSPAGFRRRVAYDVINDYVLPVLDDSEDTRVREAKATLLPGFITAILQKVNPSRLRQVVERCITVYKTIGIELPEIGKDEDILEWVKKCFSKRQGETPLSWMLRVAIAAHCILSYACLEEAIIVEAPRPLY